MKLVIDNNEYHEMLICLDVLLKLSTTLVLIPGQN